MKPARKSLRFIFLTLVSPRAHGAPVSRPQTMDSVPPSGATTNKSHGGPPHTKGRSLFANGCVMHQTDLVAALDVVDGSEVLLCANNTIKISSTVVIKSNTHVELVCQRAGCEITSETGFGGTLFQTTPGEKSKHRLTFKGVLFANAGNGVQSNAHLFDITGGRTTIRAKNGQCSFDNNTFVDEIIKVEKGRMKLIGCDFTNNVGELEIVSAIASKLLFKNVVFKENKAQNNTGVADLLFFVKSNVRMRSVKFISNEADEKILSCEDGCTLNMFKVDFTDNTAHRELFDLVLSSLVMNNCTVARNSADFAIWKTIDGSVELTQVNFIENQANEIMFASTTSLSMTDCAFEGNDSEEVVKLFNNVTFVGTDVTFVNNKCDNEALSVGFFSTAALNRTFFDDNTSRFDMLVGVGGKVTCDEETVFCDGAKSVIDAKSGSEVNGCDNSVDTRCMA